MDNHDWLRWITPQDAQALLRSVETASPSEITELVELIAADGHGTLRRAYVEWLLEDEGRWARFIEQRSDSEIGQIVDITGRVGLDVPKLPYDWDFARLAIREVAPVWHQIPDEGVRQEVADDVAEVLGLARPVVISMLKAYRPPARDPMQQQPKVSFRSVLDKMLEAGDG